jgi:hypothetical protein
MKIKADDVGGLGFEVRVVAGHVAFQTMRFQTRFFPNAMHGVFTDAQRSGQFAAAPMGGSVAWLFACGGQNASPQSRSEYAGWLAGMIGVQSIHPILLKALFPATDGGRCGLQPFFDCVKGCALCQQQD